MGVAVVALLGCGIGAQEKKETSITYQGSVQSIDKKMSMIMIKDGTAIRNVMYSASTKFSVGHTKDNKPGSVEQVKDGNYILCAGTLEAKHLMASECVYRETK
jgi:hypothetical protein